MTEPTTAPVSQTQPVILVAVIKTFAVNLFVALVVSNVIKAGADASVAWQGVITSFMEIPATIFVWKRVTTNRNAARQVEAAVATTLNDVNTFLNTAPKE